ncbi:MAG: hypothetical protein K6E53_08025, partial [Lachnospiraceae bacterium]|nr:hypothetical protein [Lachnospiraceae bacterium]
MPKGQFEEGQIQQTRTLNDITANNDQLNDLNRTQTMRDPAGLNIDEFTKDLLKEQAEDQLKETGDVKTQAKVNAQGEVKDKKVVTVTELKKEAAKVQVLIPKNAVKTKQDKALYKAQVEYAKADVETQHKLLDDIEDKIFTKNEKKSIKRKRFGDMSASDIKKRAEAAIQRTINAQGVEAYEKEHQEHNRFKFTHINKEELAEKIATFKNMRAYPYDMDKDEDFVANLNANYMLCEAAEVMQFWIEEATEAGFMPQDENMIDLQQKIQFFAEVRQYLDTQKELMKNPYYKYLAKEDISYSDKDLEKIRVESAVKDENIKSYIDNVLKIRSLHFVRSHGVKSGTNYALEKARRATEILRTKQEKREMIDTLADNILSKTVNKRFADPNYDDRFTQKLFEDKLKSFKDLDLKEVHYADLRDILGHFEENNLIFERLHDFSHLLTVALNRGMKIPDNELIALRAKIQVLENVENMIYQMQDRIIKNPDQFVNDTTFKELADAPIEGLNKEREKEAKYEVPKVGTDLTKYLKSVTKYLKKDHNNREKTIRFMYGLTHPVPKVKEVKPENDGDGDDESEDELEDDLLQVQAGHISDEELKRRMDNYQKNAVFSDYVTSNMNSFNNSGVSQIAHAYARKTGRKVVDMSGRTLSPYFIGKSVDEVIKGIDIMDFGTDEEKEELWKRISDEILNVNISAMDTRDSKSLMTNIAYKSRIEKIANNISGSNSTAPKYIKDKDYLARNAGLYSTGCGFSYVTSFEQSALYSKMKAVEFEDWFNNNGEDINDLASAYEDTFEDHTSAKFDGGVITFSEEEAKDCHGKLGKSLGRIYFLEQSNKSLVHPERRANKIPETPMISYYDELRKRDYITVSSKEDLKEIADRFKKHEEESGEKEKTLLENIEKKIQKKNPDYKYTSRDRMKIISYMAALNKDDDEEEIEKSTQLFKALRLNRNKLDDVSKQEKADAIEELFKTVMSFDISRFNFKSYKDIISKKEDDPTRFEDCHAVSLMAMDVVNYFDDYKKLLRDKDVNCRLDDKLVQEVRARCDMLMSASLFFDEKFAKVVDYAANNDLGMPLEDIMHLPQKNIEDKMGEALANGQKNVKPGEAVAQKDQDLINFWINVKSITESLEGFDIGFSLEMQEDKFRRKANLNERSRVREAANILSGNENVLKNTRIPETEFGYQTDQMFMAQFVSAHKERDITLSDRYSKMANTKSRIYMKNVSSETLKENSRAAENNMFLAKSAILLKNRMTLGEQNLDILKAFMTGNGEDDNAMVSQYADKEKRFAVLDKLTRSIMQEDISIKNAASDADFAENAYKLAQISARAIAYNKLLEANPEYLDRLRNREAGSAESDLERVSKRLNHMLAISDYYRARKLLMTDPYYILHYNDELSANRDTAKTDEQKRVSGLIKLVSMCTRRLEGSENLLRDEVSMDSVLEKAESVSRQNAYLTGRIDLSKADPDRSYKDNEEIRRYLEEAGINNINPSELGELDVDKPFPQAEKYKTKAAKGYIETAIHYQKLANDKHREDAIPPERVELYNRLLAMLTDRKGKSITHAGFHDPVTKESFSLTTNLQRFMTDVVISLAGNMSDEEILEIFESLTMTQRVEMDLTQEDQRLYARERFLDSLAKLYKIEYENLKRFEHTYGTLVQDLPISVFMQCMGYDTRDYVNRNQFGQDIANLCHEGESYSESEGQKMTTAQILVKYGKIPREMLDYTRKQGVDYYQNFTASLNAYSTTPNIYRSDYGKLTEVFSKVEFYNQDYGKHNLKIEGPKLSFGEERNIWKKVLAHSEDTALTGGNELLEHKKLLLNLYTPSEKKEIKKQRKDDMRLFHFYNAYLDEREEVLLKKTSQAVGDGVSKDVLKKLIVFHPGMLKTGKISKENGEADVAGTDEFYELVRKYTGVGIPEDKKAEAKKEAVSMLFDRWREAIRGGALGFRDVDQLMNGYNNHEKEARSNPDIVNEGSLLYKGEVRHRMFMAVQDFAETDNLAENLTDEEKKELQSRCKDQMAKELVRTIMTSDFYQNLKDIGSRVQSYDETMFLKLQMYRSMVNYTDYDMAGLLLNEDYTETLKYFGINTDVIKGFYDLEAKKAKIEAFEKAMKPVSAGRTKPTEDTQGKKAEENKEEKKTEEKKEEKKTEEKKEDKTATASNVPLNVINEEPEQQIQHYELEPIIYQANVTAPQNGVHTPYEKQGAGTTYCWACAMSGLMNAYAGKKVSDLSMIKKKPLKVPKFEESGIKNRETYNAGVALVNGMYNGTEYGNPA